MSYSIELAKIYGAFCEIKWPRRHGSTSVQRKEEMERLRFLLELAKVERLEVIAGKFVNAPRVISEIVESVDSAEENAYVLALVQGLESHEFKENGGLRVGQPGLDSGLRRKDETENNGGKDETRKSVVPNRYPFVKGVPAE